MTQIITVGIPKEAIIPKELYYHGLKPITWSLSYHLPDSSPRNFQTVDTKIPVTGKEPSILGKLSVLTDEDLCPHIAVINPSARIASYKNHQNNEAICFSPKESFISKLKSEGKVCKWMVREPHVLDYGSPEELNKQVQYYNSLPDDLLILIKS